VCVGVGAVRVCGWGRGENVCEIKDPSVDNEAIEQLDREPVAKENPASSRGGVFASRAEGVWGIRRGRGTT